MKKCKQFAKHVEIDSELSPALTKSLQTETLWYELNGECCEWLHP